jgi:hypothetical protein
VSASMDVDGTVNGMAAVLVARIEIIAKVEYDMVESMFALVIDVRDNVSCEPLE